MPRPDRTIIPAPSGLGLTAQGVDGLPAAILATGFADTVGARVAPPVEPPPWEAEIDPATGVLNARGIAEYSPRLGVAVRRVVEHGDFAIVLGGDCSVLLGCLAGLDGPGLLFLDGHADFYQPEAEPTGECASMELGFATGRGPALLTELGRPGPLVRDEDVVVAGPRDAEAAAGEGSRPLPPSIRAFDLAAVRAGADVPLPDGPFWIHLDADVLDDRLVPAVDYRRPDGLSWDELGALLTPALASGRALGLDVTILNPALDPDGGITRAFAGRLAYFLNSA